MDKIFINAREVKKLRPNTFLKEWSKISGFSEGDLRKAWMCMGEAIILTLKKYPEKALAVKGLGYFEVRKETTKKMYNFTTETVEEQIVHPTILFTPTVNARADLVKKWDGS